MQVLIGADEEQEIQDEADRQKQKVNQHER